MPLIASIVFYFISSIWAVGYVVRPNRFKTGLIRLFVYIGFAVHSGYLVYLCVKAGNIPVANIYQSIVFLVWCTVLVFIVVDFLYKFTAISAFLMPFATVFAISALFFVNNELVMPADLQKFWLISHIIPTFMGYASFSIAFVASIMYIIQQKQLRSKFSGSLLTGLPSLEGLDRLIWRTLTFGFPLITLGMVFGFMWVNSSNVLGVPWYTDHKVVLGIVSWLVYAAILHIRMIAAFHGAKIAILTICGFVLILFTFIGTFFLGVKHGFQKATDNVALENVQTDN